jgi:hypothetical protein
MALALIYPTNSPPRTFANVHNGRCSGTIINHPFYAAKLAHRTSLCLLGPKLAA